MSARRGIAVVMCSLCANARVRRSCRRAGRRGNGAHGRVSLCALARAEPTLSSSRQIARPKRRVEVTLSVEQAHSALSWYSALEALIDKPRFGLGPLLAHASCLGEFEALVIGCLCRAHAPPARYTYLGGLCGKARESRHRTDGQHC
jgi:hypothetical protein